MHSVFPSNPLAINLSCTENISHNKVSNKVVDAFHIFSDFHTYLETNYICVQIEFEWKVSSSKWRISNQLESLIFLSHYIPSLTHFHSNIRLFAVWISLWSYTWGNLMIDFFITCRSGVTRLKRICFFIDFYVYEISNSVFESPGNRTAAGGKFPYKAEL